MGNIFSAIANALSTFVQVCLSNLYLSLLPILWSSAYRQAIANVFVAIFKGIAAVLNAIVGCKSHHLRVKKTADISVLTCGKCGGSRGRV